MITDPTMCSRCGAPSATGGQQACKCFMRRLFAALSDSREEVEGG